LTLRAGGKGMEAMTVFNIISGFASIISLIIAISAKAEIREIKQQKMIQHGKNNNQAGRDIRA
jgi:hypothetical protein